MAAIGGAGGTGGVLSNPTFTLGNDVTNSLASPKITYPDFH